MSIPFQLISTKRYEITNTTLPSGFVWVLYLQCRITYVFDSDELLVIHGLYGILKFVEKHTYNYLSGEPEIFLLSMSLLFSLWFSVQLSTTIEGLPACGLTAIGQRGGLKRTYNGI